MSANSGRIHLVLFWRLDHVCSGDVSETLNRLLLMRYRKSEGNRRFRNLNVSASNIICLMQCVKGLHCFNLLNLLSYFLLVIKGPICRCERGTKS